MSVRPSRFYTGAVFLSQCGTRLRHGLWPPPPQIAAHCLPLLSQLVPAAPQTPSHAPNAILRMLPIQSLSCHLGLTVSRCTTPHQMLRLTFPQTALPVVPWPRSPQISPPPVGCPRQGPYSGCCVFTHVSLLPRPLGHATAQIFCSPTSLAFALANVMVSPMTFLMHMLCCSGTKHRVHTPVKGGVPYVLLLLLPPAVWLGLGRPFLALLLWTHPLMSANDMHGNICKNPCLIYSIQAEHLLLWVLRLY